MIKFYNGGNLPLEVRESEEVLDLFIKLSPRQDSSVIVQYYITGQNTDIKIEAYLYYEHVKTDGSWNKLYNQKVIKTYQGKNKYCNDLIAQISFDKRDSLRRTNNLQVTKRT